MNKKQQRQQKMLRQQEIVNAAKEAGRDLTAEEQTEFDSLQREIERLNGEIEAEEQQQRGMNPPANAPPQNPANPEADTQRAIQEERARIRSITELCGEFGMEARSYIESGATLDSVREAALEHVRQHGAPIPANGRVSITESAEDKFRAAAADAIVMRSGMELQNPADGARQMMGMTLRDLAHWLENIRVTVATSTDRCHVEAALVRTGLMKYVDRIFTCSEVGVGKAASPKIYEMAAEFMGTPASDTFVFEDAYHAAETAQNGGFVVVGLYDESSRDRQGDLIAHCDHYFKSMDDMLCNINSDRSRLVPVLTIAGSDSSGGAGVQADLKTMQANGVFGMSAITALTAQNTTGVTAIMNVIPDVLGAQIDAVFTDIRPKAVKIGMVSVPELIDVIADRLARYNAENVVLDPVMVATSGAKLISDDAVEVMTGKLFPLAKLITPNIPETEALTGISVKSVADMENAARCIYGKYGCAVLVKGGHSINDANDMLFDGENITHLPLYGIPTPDPLRIS